MHEPDEYKKRARIEAEQFDLLQYTSPEFQAEVEKQQAEEAKQRAAQLEKLRRQQDKIRRHEEIEGLLGSLLLWALMIGILLGVLYGLVKFVKWAWYS